MTVAYCIIAHTRPSQCRRLVQRLLDDDPGCRVLLHYDQRYETLDLSQVVHPRVRIMSERPLYWGGPEFADLYVEMIHAALRDGCSYAVLLSGQDYPLRKVGDLETELSAYDVWADVRPLFAADGSCNWNEGRRRYAYRWCHLNEPNKLLRGIDRALAKMFGARSGTELPLPYIAHLRQYSQVWWGVRSRGPGLPIHIGSQWMSLSARAMEGICSSPRRVMSFFRHVPVNDEACFHTILANMTGLTFAPSNARYICWTEGTEHPGVLTVDDFDSMVASGAQFGRKFDERVDSLVLDHLDNIGQ